MLDLPAPVTDYGDRYVVAPYASGFGVFDIATDQQVGKTHPTRTAADRSAARRNHTRAQPKDTQMTITPPQAVGTTTTWDDLAPQGDLDQIKRNQWGQPLIVPPGGGKAVGYQRVTTAIKCLDDTSGLTNWFKRQVAVGLSLQPDLRKAVDAHGPGYLSGDDSDKKTLDEVCEQAMAAADSKGKARLGTALHRITERLDRGQLKLDEVPAWALDDCAAYLRATAGIKWLHIEKMHVNDDLRVAGTPDRVALIDGVPTIVDLKTGGFYASSCAAQLGIYANSARYDIATGERQDTSDYRRDRGLVIHMPAGSGQVRLRWVDIAAGYAVASAACAPIRDWRKRRDLDLGDYERAADLSTEDYTGEAVDMDAVVSASIRVAPDAATLGALWREHRAIWTDAHTALAAARKTALSAT